MLLGFGLFALVFVGDLLFSIEYDDCVNSSISIFFIIFRYDTISYL